MKNKKKFILTYFIIFFFCNIAFSSQEINYSSNTIKILENGKIITGVAGSTADAFTLFELFESKIEQYGNLTRAAIELAKEWRTDKRPNGAA